MEEVLFNVPQGTVIGPFLFLIYVNTIEDVILKVGGKAIVYVDDTNIVIKAPNLNMAISKAQINLDEVSKLFTSLNLSINWEKTHSMLFNNRLSMPDISIYGNFVKPVSEVNFLGLTLTNDLKWKTHIEKCISKLNKGIFLLTQTNQILNTHENFMAYNAHVHSHLMYGALIWGNPYVNKICTQRVFAKQKKAMRILIFGYNKSRQSCRGLFKKFNILTFLSIHLHQCFKFVRNSNCLTQGDTHNYGTRNSNNVYRTCTSNKSVIDNASRMHNLLSEDFKAIKSDKEFVKRIKKWLIEKEFYSVDEYIEEMKNKK